MISSVFLKNSPGSTEQRVDRTGAGRPVRRFQVQVRNYRMTVASARVVALGMQSSRFYRKMGRGNIKTYYGQGEEKEAKKNGYPSWLLFQCKIPEILAAEGELSLSGSLESGWPFPAHTQPSSIAQL